MGWFKRERAVQVACEYCGDSELIWYYQKKVTGEPYWHISREPHKLRADHASRGGADIHCRCGIGIVYSPNSVPEPPHPGISFSARHRSRSLRLEALWEHRVYEALTANGLTPSSVCTCFFQQFADRANSTADYGDGGIGVYSDSRLLQFASGRDNKPDEPLSIEKLEFSEIDKIILRERSTPALDRIPPVRGPDGRYLMYDSWFQTRIYRLGNAQGHIDQHDRARPQSVKRIMDDSDEVFRWLCYYTGADCATDTQAQPLEGYAEGT